MKKLIFSFLLLTHSLQSAALVDRIVWSTIQLAQDVCRGPLSWAGFAGTAALAYTCKDNNFMLAGIGTVSLAYHLPIVKSWWWLRSELRSYPNENTEGNILRRTRWNNHGEQNLDTGFAIMQHYLTLNNDQQRIFVNNLRIKVDLDFRQVTVNLNIAMEELRRKINQYSKYSNLYSVIERAAGCNLLDTDYLFVNDIHNPGSQVQVLLREHTCGSFIANSFKIRWSHSRMLGIAVPWWYTWSHRIASQCIVKALQQYGRLKAIKSIFEIYQEPRNPLDVNLRLVGQQNNNPRGLPWH